MEEYLVEENEKINTEKDDEFILRSIFMSHFYLTSCVFSIYRNISMRL